MKDQKHSGFGVTSFIMSIVSIILFFMVFFIPLIAVASGSGPEQSSNGLIVIFGFFLFVFFFESFVSIVFGVLGLLQKERKKILAIWGIVLSATSFLIMVFLIFISLAIS